MNISLLLQMAAQSTPERRALTLESAHYDYGTLWNAAQAAAARIRASGAAYVAVLDISTPAIPIALFGAALAGVPYVPLNYRLTPEELDALVERIQPAYLITSGPFLERYRNLRDGVVIDRTEFLDAVLAAAIADSEIEENDNPIAVQLFTSGTTGKPKAAVLKHDNLMSYILGTVDFASAEEHEAALMSVPPYHIAGISAILSSTYAGRRLVQLPQFSPSAWVGACCEQAVTHAFVVPTMLSRILDEIDTIMPSAGLETLQALSFGGGKMPSEVLKRALGRLPHVAFTNAYGLTETSSTIALLGPDDHREAFSSSEPHIRQRLDSVGKPLPTVEVEIRDPDGRVLGPNEAGEVYVRGAQVSGEYLERKAVQDDGWFPTRDTGYLDEHGYLYLSGRADDVIVRGGENISPGEIEDVLRAYPGVADAAAVGIPSNEWGEAVAAAVVLRPGAKVTVDELKARVRAQLRSSRVPEAILFLDTLPHNEMGKLLRRQIKVLFATGP